MFKFLRYFRLQSRNAVVPYDVFNISSVKDSRSVEQGFRKFMYLSLMFSRVFFFLAIVLFHASLPIFVIIIFAFAAIFLPFFSVVFANSPRV